MPEQTEPQEQPTESVPPWERDGEDFNPERAWNRIQALESDKKKLQERPRLTEDEQRRLSEYAALEEASKTELDRAKESEQRWMTETDRWRKAAVGQQVRALAALDFADPDDAVTAVRDNLDQYMTAGGDIDEAAIRRDLADVLERKPHWRRGDAAPHPSRAPLPNPAQGQAGSPVLDKHQEFANWLRQN